MGTRTHLWLALGLRGVGAGVGNGEGWSLGGMGESSLVWSRSYSMASISVGPCSPLVPDTSAADMTLSGAVWRRWE